MMKRFVLPGLVLSLAAACGDNVKPGGGGDDIDAAAIDATNPDAPTDGPPPPRYTGTFTVLETQVLNPAPGAVNTYFGQGIQLGLSLVDNQGLPAPVLETIPGDPLFGCKVWEYTPAQVLQSLGGNEGTITATVTNPSGTAAPTFPTCVFVANAGYICPDTASSQAITATNNVSIATMTAGQTALMTVVGTATFTDDDVGRYVKFAGTGVPSLDAATSAIPIVGRVSDTVVVLGLGLPAATTIPVTAGTLTTLGGVGPRPGLPDPGQMADDASGSVALTAGGGNHFATTTFTWAANGGGFGDDFTMDDTNAGRMRSIPVNGTGFSINCNNCGTSTGTVLNIVTTDASVAGLSAFAMPAPMTKRVQIRCAFVGQTNLTVPDNVAAYLMSSGATRIQATYIRANFGIPSPTIETVRAIGGHAVVGFTTIAN